MATDFGLLLKVRSGNVAHDLRIFVKDAQQAAAALINFLKKQGADVESLLHQASPSA